MHASKHTCSRAYASLSRRSPQQSNAHEDADANHDLSNRITSRATCGAAYLGAYLMLMLRSAELLPVATFCARKGQAVVRTLTLHW